MEGSGLRGGVFSNLSPGILGLEMPIQPQQQLKQPQQQQQQQQQQRNNNNNNNHQHLHPPNMVAFARPQPRLQMNNQQLLSPLSDDDDDDNLLSDAKRKPSSSSSSTWQRMKWTDAMVRLLIMAVYYIGDECGSDATTNTSSDAARKKAGALMQKKGKWKSVSNAMIEKGFYVSPQQCEDKFNDLNKRYKRVNEILGKGTACRVVENQSLLDQMDHLTAKSKEEVRKLLNSKHLFFKEMCAYHNSCGNGPGTGHNQSPSENQQQILHAHHNSSHDTTADADINHHSDNDDSEDEESEEESEQLQLQPRCSTKRRREEEGDGNNNGTATSLEMALRGFEAEMGEIMEDGRRSGWEKKSWMKTRMVKVEEERVGKEKEGLEIEKERLKWLKYCGKKEREMERKKLKNERAKLECDRMVLLLKHKEVEMMALFKNMAATATEPQPPSSVTGC